MSNTIELLKELRDLTLASLTDCKKALESVGGNIEKAVVFLREKGIAGAAKKAGRVAAEGSVCAFIHEGRGYSFEINCETDFVTRNEKFQSLVNDVQQLVVTHKPRDLPDLLSLNMPSGQTVQETVTLLIATIGENIVLRRYTNTNESHNVVACYIHGNGRIGVLVELTGDNIAEYRHSPVLQEVAREVALQAAAMRPQYLSSALIPADVMAKETDIIRNKFLNQDKPKSEAALVKIIPSSLKSWCKEVCLVEQPFLKNESQTVGEYVAAAGVKVGVQNLSVASFVRFELGEGVDKGPESDLATEVEKTLAQFRQS